MEAFLTSTLLVAVAEIGDKTQLLSFVLAARLRQPWAIIAGILVATVANHALAGSVGAWLAHLAAEYAAYCACVPRRGDRAPARFSAYFLSESGFAQVLRPRGK